MASSTPLVQHQTTHVASCRLFLLAVPETHRLEFSVFAMIRKLRFLSAFLIAGCIAAFANLLPYLRSRGAYQYDGQEVAGFPYAFRRIGGDCLPAICDTYHFHPGYFAADLGLALACAVAAGLIAASVGKGPRDVA
ncbi:hypothetical protein D3C81_1543870 [compost metagenome]